MAGNKQQKGSGELDAVQLLRKDHDEVNAMFAEFDRADDDRKFELAAEICQALTIHATLEAEIFYPRVREAIDAEDMIIEAEVEHDLVRHLVERVQEGELDEVQLSAMIKVLKDYVGHHVQEEQRRLFPQVKRAALDLVAMGCELRERKAALESELAHALEADTSRAGAATGDDDDPEDAPVEPGRARGGMAAKRGREG